MIKRLMTILVVMAFAATIVLVGSCDKLGDVAKIPGTVAGQLLNEAGQGQGFIAVQLVDMESGKIVDSINADDNGNFMFKAVDPGKYIIKTMPIGGGELPNDCEEFKLMPGKTENKSITVTYPQK